MSRLSQTIDWTFKLFIIKAITVRCVRQMSSGDVETVNVKQMVSPSPAWLHQNPPSPSHSSSSSCCLTSLWPVCTYNYWSWPSNAASTQQSATVLTGQHWSNHTTQQRHTGPLVLLIRIYLLLFIYILLMCTRPPLGSQGFFFPALLEIIFPDTIISFQFSGFYATKSYILLLFYNLLLFLNKALQLMALYLIIFVESVCML